MKTITVALLMLIGGQQQLPRELNVSQIAGTGGGSAVAIPAAPAAPPAQQLPAVQLENTAPGGNRSLRRRDRGRWDRPASTADDYRPVLQPQPSDGSDDFRDGRFAQPGGRHDRGSAPYSARAAKAGLPNRGRPAHRGTSTDGVPDVRVRLHHDSADPVPFAIRKRLGWRRRYDGPRRRGCRWRWRGGDLLLFPGRSRRTSSRTSTPSSSN